MPGLERIQKNCERVHARISMTLAGRMLSLHTPSCVAAFASYFQKSQRTQGYRINEDVRISDHGSEKRLRVKTLSTLGLVGKSRTTPKSGGVK